MLALKRDGKAKHLSVLDVLETQQGGRLFLRDFTALTHADEIRAPSRGSSPTIDRMTMRHPVGRAIVTTFQRSASSDGGARCG
jgi:hypothetical protein